MTETLPLVRAAALGPFHVWMRENGRSFEDRLRHVGLPASLMDEPNQPVPLRAAVEFIAETGRQEGADSLCRIVEQTGLAPLGFLGAITLGASTPREACQRAVRAFTHHGSHEMLTFDDREGVLRHAFRVRFDDETLHYAHQYIAALFRAVGKQTGWSGPLVSDASLMPHPQMGLSALGDHFECELRPERGGAATVTIAQAVIDRPYQRGRSRSGGSDPILEGCAVIRGDGTLSGSIRQALPALLEQQRLTVAKFAGLAFMSTRTFQRRLTAERTTLSELIDRAREELALSKLKSSPESIAAVAAELGYSSNASFTHAVRRWTSEPPRRLRSPS